MPDMADVHDETPGALPGLRTEWGRLPPPRNVASMLGVTLHLTDLLDHQFALNIAFGGPVVQDARHLDDAKC